ncbi:tape measure protein [uncultured Secundilactobacillus sp.]|uniref:tape measure protein n=1 Tax=uncultured Secundilactobacillus sp. TaxID=2813935 RepID=UPI00258AB3FA|nr:tape measure protein [uncultured Secundilactobacillus sp.]
MAGSEVSATIRINDAFSGTLSKLGAGVKGAGSALNNLGGSAGKTGSMFKSVLGGTIVGAGITRGIAAVGAGMHGLLATMDENSKAWQTFEGNMSMIGRSKSNIASVKSELQDFAHKTIYSASDMANTYGQLAAVGTKNTTALVKGFGGLASAADDPKQAMKSLSQQAVQMAALPKVKWADLRIMMQQAPVGITQVAKAMHKSTGDLIADVQAGKVKTQDFLQAMAKVGSGGHFQKMATEYKTAGQALDGMVETVSDKMGAGYQSASQVAIKAISGITDKLSDMDFSAFNKIAKGAMTGVVKTITAVGKMIGDAMKNISKMDPSVLKNLGLAFGILKMGTQGLVLGGVVAALKVLGTLKPSTLNTLAKGLTAVAIALTLFKGYQAIKGVARALKGLGSVKTPKVAVPDGGAAAQSAVGFLKLGAALLMIGGAVLLAGAGMFLLAQAAIQLASAGWPAIAMLAGLVVVLVAIAVAAAVFAPALMLGGAALLVFGAGLLIVAAAGMVAALAVMLLAAAMPIIAAYGMTAAIGIMMFGAGLTILAVGALLAGVAIMVFAVGLMLVTPFLLLAAVGVLLLGAASFVLGAGLLVVGAALMVVAAGMAMVATAVMTLVTAFITAGSMMVSAITSAMSRVVSAVSSGIQSAVSAARGFAGALVSVGADLIQGLVNGIKSMIGAAVSAVTSVASSVVNAAKSILHIGSPSKLFAQYGSWVVQGLANGLNANNNAQLAAQRMSNGVVDAANSLNQIGLTNPGDMLAAGFNRAYAAVSATAGAMGNINGTQIGVNGSLNGSTTSTAPTSTPFGTGSGVSPYGATSNTATTQTSSSNTINIQPGAISLTSTGNADMDGEAIARALENHLMKVNERQG